MSGMSATVTILFDGYSRMVSDDVMEANCTCSLIQSDDLTIIVDTLTAWDKDKLLERLQQVGVTNPHDVTHVVSTHGHSDHVGNNNLFLKATHIVGHGINRADRYTIHPFDRGEPYKIGEHVQVIATPGHTLDSVSVIVSNSRVVVTDGEASEPMWVDVTTVVAGDLFEKQEDIQDDQVWIEAGSDDQELQRQSRRRVIEMADVIVPGHGPPFRHPK